MAVSESLVTLLQEQLEPLGRITFGACSAAPGVYCDGVIFGLILRDALHFKVDDGNRAAYEAEGMAAVQLRGQGQDQSRSAPTGACPSACFDEPDEMLGVGARRPGRWTARGCRQGRQEAQG